MAAERWIPETLFDDLGFRMTFKVERVLYEQQTSHHHLILFEQQHFGKVLMLDGATQVTTQDEFVYHEMMTHVPILAHGKARKVLIIGGGDGGILREALRHKAVRKVTMVEIDRGVVDMCLKYMPSIPQKAFDDKRTDLVIADGARFVAETTERYDVVIVDSTDPMGPGEVLFTEAFYRNCRGCMTPGGVIVNQNGVPFMQPDEVTMTYRRRKKSFKVSSFYVAAVPSYYGGFVTLGWASNDTRLHQARLATIAKRAKAARLKTRYYTPEVHVGSFALPQFVRSHIK